MKQLSTKLIRVLCVLLTACLLLPAAAGCGKTDPVQDESAPETETTASPATEEQTIITVPETDAPATLPETDAVTEPQTEPVTEPETEADTTPVVLEAVPALPEVMEFTTALTVTAQDAAAAVKTASGLSYTAEGYAAAGDAFTVTREDGMTIRFAEGTFTGTFNRWSIGYTATEPMYGTVTYTIDDYTVTDDFYLDAGTNTFACLLSTYLRGKIISSLDQMTIRPCRAESADFALCALETTTRSVYPSGIYYIENGRLKVGIRLSYGGGICSLTDAQNPVRRLSNLINQADTGRLVQQSYYGTGDNDEYTCGTYNGSSWSYNPVQGGDVFQNHSRIIDIIEGTCSVYVKSQPQDWSHDNDLTPSYMENVYTVYGDVVRVDNRFTDYSGWTHPYRDQELPAFYTVSYLDTFTYYNGSLPWTGASLTVQKDLPFWGAEYHNDCVFRMTARNTETWCAWYNEKSDYGIGLYVPNIDTLLAGRYNYNGSYSAMDGATNYVAPLVVKRLVSFDTIEYSYLMTTGSVEQIREIFTANRGFAENGSLHYDYHTNRRADEDENLAELDLTDPLTAGLITQGSNSLVVYDKEQEALAFTVLGSNPQTNINYKSLGKDMNAADYNKVVIEYMIPTTNKKSSYKAQLYFIVGDITKASNDYVLKPKYVKDGEWHTLTVDLSTVEYWKGKLTRLRFDFFESGEVGDTIYVRSIRLVNEE